MISISVLAVVLMLCLMVYNQQATEKRINLIRLKLLAGNISDEDNEWMRKTASRSRYKKRNNLARWRVPDGVDTAHKRKKMIYKKLVEYRKIRADMDKYRAPKITQYYPSSGDFLSMEAAARGLRRDVEDAKVASKVPAQFKKTVKQFECRPCTEPDV